MLALVTGLDWAGIVFGGLVLIGGMAAFAVTDRRRRAAIQRFARERGWPLDQRADDVLREYPPTSLLDAGYRRWVTNLFTFTADGHRAHSFDYAYLTPAQKGSQPFHVVSIELPARFPVLELRPERLLDPVGKLFGLRDLQFESADFNSAWLVAGTQAPFGYDLIHPRMMEWLLTDAAGSRPFTIGGDRLYTYRPGNQRVEDIDSMVEELLQFRSLIPDHVWRRAAGE
ncbi:MAG: hypothetical protein ACTH2Q_14810 [Propionibacteriaceae bacterium]